MTHWCFTCGQRFEAERYYSNCPACRTGLDAWTIPAECTPFFGVDRGDPRYYFAPSHPCTTHAALDFCWSADLTEQCEPRVWEGCS